MSKDNIGTRKNGRPEVLIEHWLPVQELGIESRRERAASSALPPLYFLHVWWARRPLTVSRAAILAALLPPDTDHAWFLKTLGIKGNPVAAYRRILEARKTGGRFKGDAYGYKRAFTFTPDPEALEDIHRRIAEHWGREMLTFLDPMAGGGSIPFEAMRYGLNVWANELNPVACVILKATLEYPAHLGEELAEDIRRWADEVHRRARAELERFYPCLPGEQVSAYIWAHTVKCPGCGLIVPLSPNWWLERGERRVAARPVVKGQAVEFEILEDPEAAGFSPSDGTISRGKARCPGCGITIGDERLRQAAREDRMGYQLVALVVKRGRERDYRQPGKEDLAAVNAAERYLLEHWPVFERDGLVPTEQVPPMHPKYDPRRYGMTVWWKMFTPRQLLSHVVHLKYIQEVKREMARELGVDGEGKGALSGPEAAERRLRWQALMTYLALILDKCLDYNARMSTWENTRQIVKHVFDRHDYSFKWSFGEAVPVYENWPWAASQILDAYRQLARLAAPYRMRIAGLPDDEKPQIRVTKGNAAAYYDLPDGSVDIVVVDPPYYHNVMYAECSDFFYVWQKRALGDVFPELFSSPLTDKGQEAVANVALFKDHEDPKKAARRDYEDKMRAAFRRLHGLLRDDGVMVVMFTHKQTEAWDALATALIEGGWEITASWPVHTESEHSLHQAKKNAAQSTILLVCRKRAEEGNGGWWNQVHAEIERRVKERVEEYEALGIRGVDLMLATFGPALQVICRHWPVRRPSGEAITPEYALDLARKVVREHRWLQLVGKRPVEVDRPSQFVIYAWDFYKAEQIRFDEARKLYMGLGVELDELKRRKLVQKAQDYLRLLGPRERERKGGFDPEAEAFETVIDALHATIWWYEEGGLGAVKRLLGRTKLARDPQFLAGLQAYLRALPAMRDEYKALKDVAEIVGEVEVPEDRKQWRLELGL